MALVQHVSYAIAAASKLHPLRDFLKETVHYFWSEDINKVFSMTKAKLANNLEEGIMSWPSMVLGTSPLTPCAVPLGGHWPVCKVGFMFTHITWSPC
jgi:hypothetical protein